ncbi:hypothetical protein [Homoserinimonas sp. OAct 916]|uniref:hypothetical protein n=1 Tax=Homoserinimonas sp. OAct 916 TaxID=2211450 RepID=UPI00130082BC|nr:hypothetical protein [Homoserinimonas sp. OAct 916]
MAKKRLPWWDRAFNFFYPWGGPCQLGPYGEPELPPASGKACPMCGAIMSSHRIERRDGQSTKLHCPAPSSALRPLSS